MCGIVAVVAGEDGWEPAPNGVLQGLVDEANAALPLRGGPSELIEAIESCVRPLGFLASALHGPLRVLMDRSVVPAVQGIVDAAWAEAERVERELDTGAMALDEAELQQLNEAIVSLKDHAWRISHDCLRIIDATHDLAGHDVTPDGLVVYAQIGIALSAIDRLEVRGRDSAGIAVVVRSSNGNRCFVYKAAAEIGELGDNTNVIRNAVSSDQALRSALVAGRPRAVVLGHTRWASVGLISQANAHPLSSEEIGRDDAPFVVGVLNGDIDNHADIRADEQLEFPLEVTTDAKIIPVLISRRLSEGLPLEEAFRRSVASFEGSVAIGAVSLAHPDRVLLALRGSGQALYVALGEGCHVVASEPYGFVEQGDVYLRMDGEHAGEASARGQIVVLRPAETHQLAGITRFSYDGTPLPVDHDELRSADITTRDVDRGDYPHFLIKELYESPRSFRKTLRGRLLDRDGRPYVALGRDVLPDEIRERLRDGSLRRIVVIGQGTAAISGRAVAAAIDLALRPATIRIEALAATELSGFGLVDDMSDTLVVAISQSGTTTDTNRTVEVARARGAWIVAIVNRRHSDLTDRAHGVLYTSDGRDVEMAVPSTKAFYAQIAAGYLLAAALAEQVDGARGVDPDVLVALRELPDAMDRVLSSRADIADVARRHVLSRRDWAIVGNGLNRIAAEEIRIKLSELCYKSIACDITEEKKHIDLSAEPLILVCAAGIAGSNAEDVAKEVAILRAHKAAPIVICGDDDGRFEAALDVIRVPSVHPDVAFVLSAMAGHVFGYEAALAIDAQAHPLREARAAVEAATKSTAGGMDALRALERLRPTIQPMAARFLEGLRAGSYDGHLEPSTAVRLASLLRYATGISPLDAYHIEHGKIGTPSEVLTDLTDALTTGIDELTRPVDAIRHQAKTVTVGITRAEETLLHVPLVREVLNAGVPRDRLTYGTLRTLAALDPAVERINGYTLYAIEGDVRGDALIRITDRGGISRDIPSRTDRDPRLRGTKHRVAVEREVLVARGHDGRTLIFVPEVKGAEVTGVALMHAGFHDRLPADVMRSVLQGYRDRHSALRDIVTESEPTFRDDLLAEIPVVELLIASIQALAERWRAT